MARQSVDQLKQVLRYDPDTGHFHWLIHTRGRGGAIHPGDIAGTRKDGYIQIKYAGHIYRANRLAWQFMTGRWPSRRLDVEHRDGSRSNNSWENLFAVNRTKNMQNLSDGLRSDNKSGCRGVSWRADTEKWHARIKLNGRIILLGDYVDLNQAISARKDAERKYW